MASPEGGPRLALGLVRIAARWVPRLSRHAWLREWEGELMARWHELEAEGSVNVAARLDLLARASGSVVDAMSYRMSYSGGRWMMGGWAQDLKLAVRGLVRRPRFTAVIVLTLALTIGANAALFSVAKDVLLRPFPYPEPNRVVAMLGFTQGREGFTGSVTYPNLADIGEAAKSFRSVGATRWWRPALEGENGGTVLRGATVTANFFDILGVEAGVGRFFRPDEQGAGRDPVVVLSHGLWQDRFGGDRAIVGGDIRLNGQLYRVIGVTAADFEDPWIMDGPGAEPQVWRTVASPPSEWPRSGRSWKGLARLRPDISIETAQQELDGVFARLVAEYPEHNANRVMRIVPLRERIAGPADPVLRTLLASVALLLVIACANLANLMLGRALDRRAEFAVHRALGASGWQLLRRGLAEAGLLATAGGLLGLVLAFWLAGLSTGLSSLLPRPVTGTLDMGVLGFALAVTAMAGALFGLAPAIHAARSGPAGPGRDGVRSVTTGRHGQRLRGGLVTGELALTTALLIGSGILVRDFHRLGAVELGLETEGVVAVELHGSAWWSLDPASASAQWDAVLDATRSVPGVTAAGAMDYVPLGGDYSCDEVEPSDRPRPMPGEGRCAEVRVVLPGALEAMGVPLIQGRMLDDRDGGDQPRVAVIDRTAAQTFWPGENPVGKRFRVHTNEHEVVGVVGNMLHFGPGGAARPMVYLHAPQEGWNGIARGLSLIVASGDSGVAVAGVRAALAGVNPWIAVGDVHALERLRRQQLAEPRFRTGLMAAFALTALLLAVLGIAGVMSYSVSRRTREIGVRLALGAQPGEVRRLVLSEGARLVTVGVVAGLAGALAVAGVLEALLFQVSARDPMVYAGAVTVIAGAALLACYHPAHRASNVDPKVALAMD